MLLRSFFLLFLILGCHPTYANEISPNNDLFVEVEEVVIPVVQRRDVAGFFAVTLAVDCKTKEVADKLREHLPTLRDRLFWDLYVLLGVIWTPDFRTNMPDMKKRLKRRVETLVGKDQINDVLIINFQEHERINTDLTD
jgi:flagellar basal body-associated protein FliL